MGIMTCMTPYTMLLSPINSDKASKIVMGNNTEKSKEQVVICYEFTDARGIRRRVHYVADHAGFRAQVKNNEPGTANQNPVAVHIISTAPHTGIKEFWVSLQQLLDTEAMAMVD